MRARPRRDAALAGALAVVALVAGLALDPTQAVKLMRARVYDRLLALVAPARLAGPRIVIVDIDEGSLARMGPWPWRRVFVARLIAAARNAGAAAIGVDILFAAPETLSPAALARRLAEATGDAHARDLAGSLTDDDSRLAQALEAGRVALGFALDPDGEAAAPTTPVLVQGTIDLGGVWSGAGGVYPLGALAKFAAIGALALPGDADGVVRRAPLFVSAGGVLKPGLALETLRLARGASVYLLKPAPRRVVSGEIAVGLSRDALLRLAPLSQDIETVSAADALERGFVGPLNGAVVFIGASAPEAGVLRATADDPLTSSTVIEARAARQIAAGFSPQEVDPSLGWAIGAGLGAALIPLAFLVAAPLAYAIAAVALAAPFAAAFWAAGAAWLVDPIEVAAPALAGFAAAAAVTALAARRRAQALRARFERHLAPQVIDRIVASEGVPKLRSEMREVTALFTDIEGFTGMVGRAEPEALVRALDAYFEGVTRIALAHGGLVGKFVGDAVHVFFNMPLDLPDHANKALDCAIEIVRWTEEFRRGSDPAALGFGRTRIGLESGPALVGEVGGGAKLDYTAHGPTVNAAARLEQANKVTCSAICVGPGAASQIVAARLRPVGALELRGFAGPVEASTVWPEGASQEWRARYLDAYARRESKPKLAAEAFSALAREIDDPIAAKLAGCEDSGNKI
jgi:adenylate cyclase